jgi:hypothetical protein
VDLSSWDPEIDGPLRLDGEWAFHWMRLVDPSDQATLDQPPEFRPVPGTFKGAQTFATYHLRIHPPSGRRVLGLRLRGVGTAYRMFVNSRLVAAAGQVATDAADAAPSYRPAVAALHYPPGEKVDFVLQVSNFHYAKGGAWEPIWLGTVEDMRKLRQDCVVLTFFLVGAFLTFGIYHLSLWWSLTRVISPLYFSGVCFATALRVLTVDDVLLMSLFPSMPWEWLVKLEYASLLLIAATTAPFLYNLFPREVPRWVPYSITGCGLTMVLQVLLTTPASFSRWLPLFQIFLVAAALMAPIFITKAAIHRRSGALLMLIGVGAVALTGVHDALLAVFRDLPILAPLKPDNYLLPFGYFTLVLLQAIVLSRRFSHAFVRLENARDDLDTAHSELDAYAHELEERVAERTSEPRLTVSPSWPIDVTLTLNCTAPGRSTGGDGHHFRFCFAI